MLGQETQHLEICFHVPSTTILKNHIFDRCINGTIHNNSNFNKPSLASSCEEGNPNMESLSKIEFSEGATICLKFKK
jgi:hypothetical protein